MSEPALQGDAARSAAQRKAAVPDPDFEVSQADRANSVQAQTLSGAPIVEAEAGAAVSGDKPNSDESSEEDATSTRTRLSARTRRRADS
jgi:hypothetical protein